LLKKDEINFRPDIKNLDSRHVREVPNLYHKKFRTSRIPVDANPGQSGSNKEHLKKGFFSSGPSHSPNPHLFCLPIAAISVHFPARKSQISAGDPPNIPGLKTCAGIRCFLQ
jgi:hypothetical protein